LERLQQLSEVLGVKINSIVGDDDMYIQQNFHQQGGNASTVMYITGLAEKEGSATSTNFKPSKAG